jgi:hypothetical protein
MRSGLSRIDEHPCAGAMGAGADLRGGIDIPGHIRDVSERNEPRALREFTIEVLQQNAAFVVYVDEPNRGTGLLGHETPRQQIGGVL